MRGARIRRTLTLPFFLRSGWFSRVGMRARAREEFFHAAASEKSCALLTRGNSEASAARAMSFTLIARWIFLQGSLIVALCRVRVCVYIEKLRNSKVRFHGISRFLWSARVLLRWHCIYNYSFRQISKR